MQSSKHGAVVSNHVQGNATTHFFELPCLADATVFALQIVWHDATSAFGTVLQSTNQPQEMANSQSADANDQEWSDEATTLPTVAAGAAGSWLRHISGHGAKRSRIGITTTAASRYSIFVHAKE
jgi:hypothetical protein